MERGLAAPTTLCASPITQYTQQGLQQATFSSHSSPTELTLTHPFPPSPRFLFFFPAESARGGNGGMERGVGVGGSIDTRTCGVAGWKPWCGNSHPTLTSPPLNQPLLPLPGTIVYDYTQFRSMKGAIYFLHLSTKL